MKLGANSVLFGGYDMETAFKYLAMAGYDGLEVSAISGMSEHLVLSDWRAIAPEIRRLSGEYGLELLAMEQPSQDADIMESAFQAAAETGIPIINCGPGGTSGDEESLQASIESLGRLADRAETYGVTLCVKAHVGASIYDTPTTLRAMEAISSPAFGIDMDPSHIHRADENPVEAIKAVLPRVRHVHIRDCKGRQAGPGAPEDQANGRGDIDLVGYVRALHEGGYDGPLNLEVIGAKEYSLEQCCVIAAETRGHMQACSAGVRRAVRRLDDRVGLDDRRALMRINHSERHTMKITKLETFLVKPRWLFLKMHTDEGLVGLGEPILEGRAKTCAQAVAELEPYLIGKDPTRVVHHWQAMYRHAFYRGGPILTSALSGVEQALWDLSGKALGVPVYKLLGGPTRDRIRLYKGGGDPDTIGDWIAQGFTCFKTGRTRSVRPGSSRTRPLSTRPPATSPGFAKSPARKSTWPSTSMGR